MRQNKAERMVTDNDPEELAPTVIGCKESMRSRYSHREVRTPSKNLETGALLISAQRSMWQGEMELGKG